MTFYKSNTAIVFFKIIVVNSSKSKSIPNFGMLFSVINYLKARSFLILFPKEPYRIHKN